MTQKKILVSLGPSAKDLKSVRYALALAERLQAQIYILQQVADTGSESSLSAWLGEALLDLINSARQTGLTMSYHIARGELSEEIINLIKTEGINLFVFGEEDGIGERLLTQIRASVPSLKVKEKSYMNYLHEEG